MTVKCRDKKHFGGFFVLLVLCWMTTPLEAQGGMDGQDVVDDESSKDMMEHDPNIVNPINQEGYGKNVPTSVGDSAGKHFLALCIN